MLSFYNMKIETTLQQRGSRYGNFAEHARITQNLKRAMQDSPNWQRLKDDQRESLEMLAHKVGRILNGDPDYHDSWHDIIGYTKLVADRLEIQMTPNETDDNATSLRRVDVASSIVVDSPLDVWHDTYSLAS